MIKQFSISMAAATILLTAIAPGQAQQGKRFPQAESSRRVCTQEYDPVCGRRSMGHRTFANACEAQRAGYFVEYEGRCRRAGRRPDRRDQPRFCTREYAPVCAVGRNGKRTFGNSCEARAAGYRIVGDGRC